MAAYLSTVPRRDWTKGDDNRAPKRKNRFFSFFFFFFQLTASLAFIANPRPRRSFIALQRPRNDFAEFPAGRKHSSAPLKHTEGREGVGWERKGRMAGHREARGLIFPTQFRGPPVFFLSPYGLFRPPAGNFIFLVSHVNQESGWHAGAAAKGHCSLVRGGSTCVFDKANWGGRTVARGWKFRWRWMERALRDSLTVLSPLGSHLFLSLSLSLARSYRCCYFSNQKSVAKFKRARSRFCEILTLELPRWSKWLDSNDS